MPAPRAAPRPSPFDVGVVAPFDVPASATAVQLLSPFDAPSLVSSPSYAPGAAAALPLAAAGPPIGAPEQATHSTLKGVAPDYHSEGARYFVITSNTKEHVIKSVKHSLWATQRKNEATLDAAFHCSPAVILVFSVNRSDAFQGYALMRSPVGRPRPGLGDPFNGFGRLFDVEWLRLHDLQYREVENIRNPLDGDRSVRFSRDGQEIANQAGQRLCRLIDRHIDEPDSFQRSPDPSKMQAPSMLALPPPPPVLPPVPPGPWGASAVPPGARPITAQGAREASSGSSGGSAEDLRQRRKRRRRERRGARLPPEPTLVPFDDQVAYFASLDYVDYVQWWRRHGAAAPGPALPAAGFAPGPPPLPAGLPMLALGV